MKKNSGAFIIFIIFIIFIAYAEDQDVSPSILSPDDLKVATYRKIVWKKDNSEMIRIPSKNLSDPIFYMDAKETTVCQFRKFVEETNHPYSMWKQVNEYSPKDDHPMIYVSWNDANAYAEWAGKRLPTEKEWEHAARSGLTGQKFPWGDDENVARNYANYEGASGKDEWDNSTAPVGSFEANGYGIHDISGNVWEWCKDWYDEEQKFRVLRGGSWESYANGLNIDNRFSNYPSNRNYIYGFRCVSGLN